MQRAVEVTVPPSRTDELVDELLQIDGVLGVQVQRGGSFRPPGDVIRTTVSNQALHVMMRLLGRQGIGMEEGTAITTNHLTGAISPPTAERMGRERSDLTWEEIELEIGKESNMTSSALVVMAVSGALATVGIATNALHIVIGAMAIAPGFAPLVRVALGIVARGDAMRRGLRHTGEAYASLLFGAVATSFLLRLAGIEPLPGEGGYLPSGALLSYWTTIDITAVLIGLLAGGAGGLLVATDRAVLTAGVMIALALVPSIALVGVALVVGEFDLLGTALLRWGVDAVLVVAGSIAVFIWKRIRVHQRRTVV